MSESDQVPQLSEGASPAVSANNTAPATEGVHPPAADAHELPPGVLAEVPLGKPKLSLQQMWSIMVTETKNEHRHIRRKAKGFFLALALLPAVFLGAIAAYVQGRQDREAQMAEQRQVEAQERAKGEEIKKNAHVITESIGVFQFETEAASSDSTRVINVTQVELVVECSSKEVCEEVKLKMQLIRDQVTQMLQKTTRKQWMSFGDKQRIKDMLKERLNGMLGHGRIEKIFIARMIVS